MSPKKPSQIAPQQKQNESLLERAALKATRGIGSIQSLIVHTILFIGVYSLSFFGFDLDRILLVLTTILSFEAIYLAIFIQMTVNRNTTQLHEVEKDIEEISEDIEDIQEDVEDIQEEVEGISEDIEDIQEDVEEISEEETQAEKEEKRKRLEDKQTLEKIESTLVNLLKEIEDLKKK